MAKIKLLDVSKSYDDKKILKNINITINQGEFVILLGPSGSGKTTILHGIAGLIPFDSGEILFDDERINDIPIEKRNAVLVDQNLLLFPHMTVYSNIAFGLKMRKVDKKIIEEKVYYFIDLMGLKGHEKKYPNELSGGQMQRVAIARALAIEPKVLLLDEPFSKLDIVLRKNMQEFVKDLHNKIGITTIMVTHDKEEALSMADRVAILIDGEIKQYDIPKKIYEQPISKEVADFFGLRNYFEGYIENGVFRCEIGEFKVNDNYKGKITFVFRPEQIIIGDKDDYNIKGIVKKKIYTGDKVSYVINIYGKDILCTEYLSKNYQVGKEVSIKIDFEDAIYFK